MMRKEAPVLFWGFATLGMAFIITSVIVFVGTLITDPGNPMVVGTLLGTLGVLLGSELAGRLRG